MVTVRDSLRLHVSFTNGTLPRNVSPDVLAYELGCTVGDRWQDGCVNKYCLVFGLHFRCERRRLRPGDMDQPDLICHTGFSWQKVYMRGLSYS